MNTTTELTDEQIIDAAKKAGGIGRVALIWTNNDDIEKPTDVAKCFARALLAATAQSVQPKEAAPSVPEAKTFSLPNIGPILPNLQTGKVELLPLQYRQALEAYARSAVISFAKAIAAAPAAQAPVQSTDELSDEKLLQVFNGAESVIDGLHEVAAYIIRNLWPKGEYNGTVTLLRQLVDAYDMEREKLREQLNATSAAQAPDADNPDELEPPELLASKLIAAWVNHHGRRIPWAKAIEISAIVTKMPEEEKRRLLALDEMPGAAMQENGNTGSEE